MWDDTDLDILQTCQELCVSGGGRGDGEARSAASGDYGVLAELRRENEVLRQERDVRNEATALFGREGSR